MNLLVGDNDLTADKDYKHVVKRLRNLLLRKMGSMVNGFHITPALLRFHLKANGVSSHRLNYLLNPSDRQNVPLCYTLLKEVWSLPDPTPSDTPSFIAARKALQLLGSLFRHIVIPFIQINLSLHEQLSHLSAAAHLATFLYTVNNSRNKALQTLTFRDIILLVKNAFFCVAKSKVSVPDGKFWIILLGTDRLESTFGLVRSMVGNDRNVDILQLGTRLSHAVECLNIFEKYPHWDRGPKRLKLPAIEDGNGDVLAKVDHINPDSWEGDVRLANVLLVTSWNSGRHMVESRYSTTGIHDKLAELDRNGYDMTFPFGTEDVDDDEESEEDVEEHDQETTQAVDFTESEVSVVLEQPIFGVGEGPLLDLEDHAAIESNRGEKGSFDPFVEIDGKNISKPRALRELFKAMFSVMGGSTDRLGRIAGLTRCAVTTPAVIKTGIEPGSGSSGPRSVLSIGDPVATALKCEGNVFLAIVQINDILIDNESVLEIAPAFLMEPVVTVQFQALQLVEIVDHVNDVDHTDADWKWNRKMERPILKTRGSCIQVIDPDVSSRVPLEPVYLFRSDELRALAAFVVDSITDEERLRLPSVKRSDFFPYRSHGAFVCSTILFLFKI